MPITTIPKIDTTRASKRENLTLTPKIHPVIKRFLDQKKTLLELTRALGSPLNVLFPELISENVEGFQKTFRDLNLIGKIFFAHKCNQSDSLTRRLTVENANLDVSSANELSHRSKKCRVCWPCHSTRGHHCRR